MSKQCCVLMYLPSIVYAMSNIRRHFLPNCMVFLTLVCANRKPWLQPSCDKARLMSIIGDLRLEYGFQFHAWVILDDHMHLLVTDPDCSIPAWIQKLKLRFVRSHPDRPVQIWQGRYWDHVIRDGNDLRRHLDYIHHNPVKHGLVSVTGDYNWSSFSSFVRRGWYPRDWQAIAEDDGEFGDSP